MEKIIERLWWPGLITLAVTMLLLILRGILLGLHRRSAKKRVTPQGYTVVLNAFRASSLYWCIALGIYIGLEVSSLPTRYVLIAKQAMEVLVLLSFTIAAANLLVALFQNFVQRLEGPVPTSGLVVGLIRLTVLATGGLIILSVMGISIAPLLTALGVGGLAVALALKDTLENLFAGIYLLTDRTVRVGDFLRLENGTEGHVEDIGWRTTRIRLASWAILIVPNSKLAQSNLTNYYLPDRRINTTISVVVQNLIEPGVVEDLLYDVVKKATEDVSGLLSTPEPTVRLTQPFGPGTMEFIVSFHVQTQEDQSFVMSELKKRFVRELRAINVKLPWPALTTQE